MLQRTSIWSSSDPGQQENVSVLFLTVFEHRLFVYSLHAKSYFYSIFKGIQTWYRDEILTKPTKCNSINNNVMFRVRAEMIHDIMSSSFLLKALNTERPAVEALGPFEPQEANPSFLAESHRGPTWIHLSPADICGCGRPLSPTPVSSSWESAQSISH